jgi:hypothetical protein
MRAGNEAPRLSWHQRLCTCFVPKPKSRFSAQIRMRSPVRILEIGEGCALRSNALKTGFTPAKPVEGAPATSEFPARGARFQVGSFRKKSRASRASRAFWFALCSDAQLNPWFVAVCKLNPQSF